MLTKIIITSNSSKNVLRYFGKVWLESSLWILWFDWLIALYLFTPLPRNASFLIFKHSCVREELSDVNKSLCKNIFLVSSRLGTSPLVRVPPQLTFPFTYHPFNGPGIYAVENFQFLRFVNSQSPDKLTGKPKIVSLPTSSHESVKHKSTFMLTFTLRTIYEVNGTAQYLERCWHATNNIAILAALLQHEEDTFLKLTVENRSQ